MRSLLTLALLLLQMLSGFACLAQSYEQTFDTLVTRWLTSNGPGATVLVAKNGQVIYQKAFGKANLELDVDMTPQHIFRIGSITKQFTASAILKLAEQGKLSVRDDITKYIPDYPTPGHTITIEHLLTHTSGIKNYTSLPAWTPEVRRKDLTPRELINLFQGEPLDFAPGTDFRYSNSGYILLGYIVEVVSGKPYDQYLRENFFEPLGMQHAYYEHTPDLVPGRIPGYQNRDSHYANADFVSMTLPYAAGGLISNADDLFTWYEALMHGKVLQPESLRAAHTSHILSNGRPTGYGYGWEIGNVQGHPTIKHTGRINGFVTYVVYLPSDKIFVAMLTNCDCANDPETPASQLAAIVLGAPYKQHAVALSKKAIRDYQGIYESDYDGQRFVAYEDERLLYFTKGRQKSEMQYLGNDVFCLAHTLTHLVFERNSQGKIVSFTAKGTGMPVTWRRTREKLTATKVISVDAKTLEKYVGQYRFASGMVLSIVKEGDSMYGQVGQDKKEILPYEPHAFFARDMDARLIFHVDQKGKVTGLTKIQSDAMDAEKIE